MTSTSTRGYTRVMPRIAWTGLIVVLVAAIALVGVPIYLLWPFKPQGPSFVPWAWTLRREWAPAGTAAPRGDPGRRALRRLEAHALARQDRAVADGDRSASAWRGSPTRTTSSGCSTRSPRRRFDVGAKAPAARSRRPRPRRRHQGRRRRLPGAPHRLSPRRQRHHRRRADRRQLLHAVPHRHDLQPAAERHAPHLPPDRHQQPERAARGHRVALVVAAGVWRGHRRPAQGRAPDAARARRGHLRAVGARASAHQGAGPRRSGARHRQGLGGSDGQGADRRAGAAERPAAPPLLRRRHRRQRQGQGLPARSSSRRTACAGRRSRR